MSTLFDRKNSMSKFNTEEKSPLLFVLDSNEDLSRARYFERSRFNGISTGATAVFTHFPNYIGSCWITTAVCGLVFFMMLLLVLSTMTAVSLRVPRCVAAQDEPINKTIHLVHVHYSLPETDQVKIVKNLMILYPDYNIRILSIIEKDRSNVIEHDGWSKEVNVTESGLLMSTISTTSSTMTTTVPEKKKVSKRRREIDFREANRFLDMLLRGSFVERTDAILEAASLKAVTTTTPSPTTTKIKIQTVEELVKLYPQNITFEITTYNQQFFASPLYPYFKFMNEKIKIFAVRVMQIWQYGGISYDLQTPSSNLKDVMHNKFGKVQNFVITERNNAEISDNSNKIGEKIVSVDDRALHLESKVPCHAFFGQLLMALRKTNSLTTVKHVMQYGIRSFCKHYAPNLDYCHMYMTI